MKKSLRADPSLNDVLARLGYTTAPQDKPIFQGKKILHAGQEVFRGTAGDVWEWLRETGQYSS